MRILYSFFLVLILLFSLPLMVTISLLALLTSGFPIFFKQKRIGKDGKVFTMYKFRTMVKNAEKQKKSLMKYNEADGPVFKIYDDPRFTKFGKFLSRISLDELPQFINILKREMNLVGPRPLPVDEAIKIPSKYKVREKVLPGIISLWVISGMHALSFNQWMELDKEYVQKKSIMIDLYIIYKSFVLIIKKYDIFK